MDVKVLVQENIAKLVAFAGLLFLLPLFHNQFITGPIINAIFFVALYFLSLKSVLLIACIPSLVALSAGLLPSVLMGIIPYIILSNFILIITFNFFKDTNYWLGIVLSSAIKFLFLSISSFVLINFFIKGNIAKAVAMMMSWPQFVTAMLGGIIAFGFLKLIKKI